MLLFASPALATANLVGCTGYAIGLSDEVLIKGQALAGSVAAFEKRVCDSSAENAAKISRPTVYPVFIEELGISTRVIVMPVGDDD